MTPPVTVTPLSEQLSDDAKSSLAALIAFSEKVRIAAADKNWKEDAAVLLEPLGQTEFELLKSNLLVLLREVDFTLAFTNAGIPNGSSFANETFRRIGAKILPYLYPAKDAEPIIHQICCIKGDCHLFSALVDTFPRYADALNGVEKGRNFNRLPYPGPKGCGDSFVSHSSSGYGRRNFYPRRTR